MSFSPSDWDILTSSFQKTPWPFSNYPTWKTFEVRNCINKENTLKIKVFEKSILFCKYLRNERSYLHEILYGDQYYLVKLSFKIHEDLYINVNAWVVNARTHVLSHTEFSKQQQWVSCEHLPVFIWHLVQTHVNHSIYWVVCCHNSS